MTIVDKMNTAKWVYYTSTTKLRCSSLFIVVNFNFYAGPHIKLMKNYL